MRRLFLFGCFTVLLSAGCSASKQSFKQAKEFEAAGLYVKSAEEDLRALRHNRNYTEALVHLRKVAPLAYNELLERVGNLEKVNNWDQAVVEYGHLNDILAECHQHGVVFETVNVKQRLGGARRKAAEYHFKNAETLYGNQRWGDAAFAYLKASDYVENYNGALDKGIQAFLNAGDAALKNGAAAEALDAYHRVLEIAPNHPGANSRAAEVHYLNGKGLFEQGDFRAALAEFEQVREYVEDYKDIERWTERTYDEAVQYVAIIPFLNQSRQQVDGYFIAADIYNQVAQENLGFARFQPHSETVAMVSKLNSRFGGSVSEAQIVDAARDEELDSIVFGKVREVRVGDKPDEVKEYEHTVTRTAKDPDGKEVEEAETIFYREHVVRREVGVVVEYVVIDVRSGKYVEQETLRRNLDDDAIWIAYQGSVYDLPEKKRHLLDAPRDPRPVYAILQQLFEKMTSEISKDVIRFFE